MALVDLLVVVAFLVDLVDEFVGLEDFLEGLAESLVGLVDTDRVDELVGLVDVLEGLAESLVGLADSLVDVASSRHADSFLVGPAVAFPLNLAVVPPVVQAACYFEDSIRTVDQLTAELGCWFRFVKRNQAVNTNFHMIPVIISCSRDSAAIAEAPETANSADTVCLMAPNTSFVDSVGLFDLNKQLA